MSSNTTRENASVVDSSVTDWKHDWNPLNDYKPVKISRDCQELPRDIGEALCDLLDESVDLDGLLNRDELPSKRPCFEPPCSLRFGEDNYNMPSQQMSWHHTQMPYPSLHYQHQAEVGRFHHQHSTSATDYMLISPGASNVAKSPLASTLTDDDLLEMVWQS